VDFSLFVLLKTGKIYQNSLFMIFPTLICVYKGIWLEIGVKNTFDGLQCSLIIYSVIIRGTLMERFNHDLRGKPVFLHFEFETNFLSIDVKSER